MIILINKDEVIIDDEDLKLFDIKKIKINHTGNKKYAYYKQRFLHHIIMNFKYDKKTNLVCDHINGNSLDNRKSNLRICTVLENAHNVKNTTRSNIGIHGLSLRKNGNYLYIRASVTDRKNVIGQQNTGRPIGKRYTKQFNVNNLGYENAIKQAKKWLEEKRKKFDYKSIIKV